ncbi:NTP transferase domain-containing protein [Candidatus Woesearchaeota archaeon]|nr:NTP transferase domain-containing protein [Candidatus Woesearchaeota archaeon]
MKRKISITIDSGILDDIDSIVDNIYIRNRSQAIEHLVSSSLGEKKDAVILAGGPEEKIKVDSAYRPTVRVKGKAVIEHAVKKLRDEGFRSIHVVASPKVLTAIFEILKDGSGYGVKVSYVEEKISKGSAYSLRLLKGKLDRHFLVVYGDLLFSKINIDELWKDHIKQHPMATIMLTTSNKPSEKGTVRVEGNKVLKFTQKPRQSDIYLVFSPIFVAEPEIFDQEGDSLEADVFPKLAEKGLLQGHLSSEKEIHIHSRSDASSA